MRYFVQASSSLAFSRFSTCAAFSCFSSSAAFASPSGPLHLAVAAALGSSLPVPPRHVPRFRWCQARGAKLLRWTPDTAVAHRLETLVEAKDFLLACQTWQDQMTRRDYLAALTLLTTRKRLDTRDALFLRFVDRVLSHPSLTDSAHIHLVMHRFAVLGHAPPLWRLASAVHNFLSSMQPPQVSLVAWSLATCYVLDNRVWNEIGRLLLLRIPSFSFTDVAMTAWAFSRMDRRNPVELMALKKRATELLDGLSSQKGQSERPVASPSSAPSPPARGSASSSAVSPFSSPTSSSAEAPAVVPPHDLCMLFRAFATLTPRDLSLHLRLFYTIVTTSCAPPAEVSCRLSSPYAPVPGVSRQASPELRKSSSNDGRAAPFSASKQLSDASRESPQARTSRSGLTEPGEEQQRTATPPPPKEEPTSGTVQSSQEQTKRGQHAGELQGGTQRTVSEEIDPRHPGESEGGREELPSDFDPADLQEEREACFPGGQTHSIWRRPAPTPFSLTAQALTAVWTALADINFLGHFPLVDSNKAAGSRGSSPSVRGASELSRSPPPSLAVRSPASGSFLSASTSVSFPTFSSLFEKTRRSSPRGPGLQVSAAGVWWMLDRLCEETRLLRLDHTVNTNMVTKLAEAMLKLNFVDPRLVYQLIHFTQKRGGEQLQPEQVLTLAKVFCALNIFDEKAWKKLAHRAQATAVDLSAKEVKELLFYLRKAGVSNQRVEGCLDHFIHLKEDIDKYGPI